MLQQAFTMWIFVLATIAISFVASHPEESYGYDEDHHDEYYPEDDYVEVHYRPRPKTEYEQLALPMKNYYEMDDPDPLSALQLPENVGISMKEILVFHRLRALREETREFRRKLGAILQKLDNKLALVQSKVDVIEGFKEDVNRQIGYLISLLYGQKDLSHKILYAVAAATAKISAPPQPSQSMNPRPPQPQAAAAVSRQAAPALRQPAPSQAPPVPSTRPSTPTAQAAAAPSTAPSPLQALNAVRSQLQRLPLPRVTREGEASELVSY
ncbi:uncharacterized protein LOC136040816 [Artemia franciscana]|uniref:uncharacterized protein LOC136040816 n=1 Tax=Artemia franciscana TaxID=6661 RepID=UPI0032D9D372